MKRCQDCTHTITLNFYDKDNHTVPTLVCVNGALTRSYDKFEIAKPKCIAKQEKPYTRKWWKFWRPQ